MDRQRNHIVILLVCSLCLIATGGFAAIKHQKDDRDSNWADYYESSKVQKTTHQKARQEAEVTKQNQKRLVGRHVCTHNKVVMKPVKHTESYCKPNYQTYIRRCDHIGKAYCTGYRVIYELAFRVVEKIVAYTEVSYSCCPGWTHSYWSSECKKALCSNQCLNGGSCLKPNQCLCPRGWTGKNCETDNSVGDKKSSGSNLKEMEELKRRILRLEKNMVSLLELKNRFDNLNQTVNRYVSEKPLKEEQTAKQGDIKNAFDNRVNERTVLKDPVTESAEERIQSLSEQMAILEERLADCTCVLKDSFSIPPTAR